MTMIELHIAKSQESIWVNVDSILAMQLGPNKDYTEIDCLDDACYCVKETPEWIMKMADIKYISYPRNHFNHNYSNKKVASKSPKTASKHKNFKAEKKNLPPVKFEKSGESPKRETRW